MVERALLRLSGKHVPTIVAEPRPEPALPLANLIGNAIPPPTSFEQAMDAALAQPARKGKGIDPRKPWIGQGDMEVVAAQDLPDWEAAKAQEALRIAITRAKLGQRLTFAQRKLLAQHGLARAMVKFRKPQGE
jgi:hypothetical protein